MLALDEHRELEGLHDPAVLELAALEERVLVTFNVRDFPDILQQWAGERRSHAGCVIVVGIARNEFGLILRLLSRELLARPEQAAWENLPVFLTRSSC